MGEYVNVDPIAQGLSYLRAESRRMTAGRVMRARLKTLAAAQESFAFKTTLVCRFFAPWLQTPREVGYQAHLVF